VNIVPEPSPPNLARLADTLVALDARLLRTVTGGIDADVRAALRHGRNLTVTTRAGDLDIVQRLPGVPSFDALHADGWDASHLACVFACALADT
jgi:hypothetical protein